MYGILFQHFEPSVINFSQHFVERGFNLDEVWTEQNQQSMCVYQLQFHVGWFLSVKVPMESPPRQLMFYFILWGTRIKHYVAIRTLSMECS